MEHLCDEDCNLWIDGQVAKQQPKQHGVWVTVAEINSNDRIRKEGTGTELEEPTHSAFLVISVCDV
jgi:hypothetical protein